MIKPIGWTTKLERASGLLLGAALLVAMAGCGGGGGGSNGGGGGNPPPPPVNNTLAVEVNLGPANNDADELLTSVTICVPGTSTCQTIPNVEVDTGSEGLRLLASQVSLSLPRLTVGGSSPLGECVSFADNSYVWGPVVTADIQLTGEAASSVPVQLISASGFPSVPAACNTGGTADDSVSVLGATGILGVGVFRQDCGAGCTSSNAQLPKMYFSCPGSSCSVTPVTLAQQLQNPVWMFPQDNNGLLISLPSVPDTGAPTASGSMIFGVGTQSDNALGSAQVFTTDVQGNFSTTYNGQTYSSSYIDSGSNGLFFLDTSTLGIPTCSGGNSAFYCPSATVKYMATNKGANGTSGSVSFSIANANTLFSTPNSAFSNIGGPNPKSFDWGLAFFFGRNVFVGIESQSTAAGVGPYWAY
ncbi:MAG TPA: DUF3443 domain-containing protein [Terriglobia bacterium]|nr:DUF3443 domain-containing protein [Terriglobia bacterium]